MNSPTIIDLLSKSVEQTMQSTTKVISTDEQVVIEISRDRTTLFSMFSTLESLDNIAHGYEMYKKWTRSLGDQTVDKILKNASTKQPAESAHLLLPNDKKRSNKKAGKLKVEMSEEDVDGLDSIWVFKIHNEQDTIVPGGLTFVCCEIEGHDGHVSFDLPMSSHGILPGNHEVLRFDMSREARRKVTSFKRYYKGASAVFNGLITLVDEQHTMKYRAFTGCRPGFSFTLGPTPAEDYQGRLTVDLYREYNVIFFHLHSGLSLPISEGLHFGCHENEDNQLNGSCQIGINGGILPGHSMVFEYTMEGKRGRCYSDIRYGQLFTSKPCSGDILICDNDSVIKYKATSILQPGIHVILEPVNPTKVQKVGDPELFRESDSDEDDFDAAITLPSEASEKSLGLEDHGSEVIEVCEQASLSISYVSSH